MNDYSKLSFHSQVGVTLFTVAFTQGMPSDIEHTTPQMTSLDKETMDWYEATTEKENVGLSAQSQNEGDDGYQWSAHTGDKLRHWRNKRDTGVNNQYFQMVTFIILLYYHLTYYLEKDNQHSCRNVLALVRKIAFNFCVA